MHSVLFNLVLLAVGAGSSLCQQVPKSADASIGLPPELARVLTDYETGWKAGDAVTLARLFTEDGFVLSPGKPPVKGRAAIEKLYTGKGSPLSLRRSRTQCTEMSDTSSVGTVRSGGCRMRASSR